MARASAVTGWPSGGDGRGPPTGRARRAPGFVWPPIAAKKSTRLGDAMADKADLQQQVQQLQQMSQQLQSVTGQRQQYEALEAEAQMAIEALEGLPADAAVYRNVGSMLIQDASKDAAQARLKDDLETMEVRIKRIKMQEAELKKSLEALQAKLQAAFAKQA